MASVLYPLAKQAFLQADIDLVDDTIKVAAVSTSDYTYSDSHQYKSSVTSYTGTTDQTISAETVTLGVFDADDFTPFASSLAISGTKDIDAWVLYKDTGNAATSPLIAYIDISANSITPNGSDVNLTWDDGANKIFAL